MKYNIKKGNHFANFTIDRLYPFVYELPFERKVKLHKSCWYLKNDIEYQGWNKLTGISGWDIHNMSARFVWQPVFNKPDNFRIAAYVYNGHDSKYVLSEMGTVKADEWFSIGITYNEVKGQWVFKVVTKNNTYNTNIGGRKPLIFYMDLYFKAFPYFGGKSVSPRNMTIEIKK